MDVYPKHQSESDKQIEIACEICKIKDKDKYTNKDKDKDQQLRDLNSLNITYPKHPFIVSLIQLLKKEIKDQTETEEATTSRLQRGINWGNIMSQIDKETRFGDPYKKGGKKSLKRKTSNRNQSLRRKKSNRKKSLRKQSLKRKKSNRKQLHRRK